MRIAFCTTILAVVLVPNVCFGDMVLDQAFTSGLDLGTLGAPDNAQTFTMGMDGILSALHVQVYRGQNRDLVLDVRNTTVGGAPTESDVAVLASTTIPYSSIPYEVPTWVAFDVSSAGIAVRSGDVLAIALRVPDSPYAPAYSWLFSTSGGYAGGQRWTRSATWADGILGDTWNGTYAGNALVDMNFRTYVVPVPGAVLLGVLGLACSGWRLRRRCDGQP
jgi:hypothetical protein